MWILNMCIFASLSENGALIFKKSNFENLKKLQSTVNIFVFPYKNVMLKQRIPLFLNNPHFSLTPPFLKKIFHPYPYYQIRGSQSPLIKGGSKYGSGNK